MDRFSYIIRGQFYGHTHNDEFRVINSYFNHTIPVGIVFTAPSLTTSNFLNPSFRVFEIDSNTKQIIDYTQYRLNLTKYNNKKDIKWDIAYKATDRFKVNNLANLEHFKEFIDKILNKSTEYKTALQNFFTEGPEYKEYLNYPSKI